MLDLMRRQSYLIYLVFGGIIFIFAINFGPGSSGCMRSAGLPQNWAARVDGEPIRHQDFVMVYQRQVEYMRRLAQRSGQEFDAAMAERMGLRKQVMDQLVERKLLAKEAEARGILVTDEDLLAYLRDQYGVKDVTYDVYENWVTHTFDTSVTRFEEDTRADIAAQRMARVVGDSLEVGDDELRDTYRQDHDRAMITFVRFTPEPSRAPDPTHGDIDKLLKDDMPTVEAQYNKDGASYRTPAQVHVRQIVRKLPAHASDADEAAARNALVSLKEQVQKGGDFAALAMAQSQDEATAKQGGDLGFVTRGQLARALDDAAFTLQPGQVSDPVRSPSGMHILQAVERREPKRRELAEVKEDVAAAVLRGRAADVMAKASAQSLLLQLQAGKKWADLTVDEDEGGTALRSAKPVRRDTPWILRTQEAMPRIGVAPEMHQAVFALTLTAPLAKQIFKVGDNYYVVALKDREVPDMSKFAAEKESLREQALDAKRNRVLRDWLAYLRNQAKVQLNPMLLAPVDTGSGNG